MLAYVFWHRPADGVAAEEYEERLRAFHAEVAGVSAAFRLDTLPFEPGGPGYEDWYLVEDWAALGALEAGAVSGARRAPHGGVAGLSGHGWGGVYGLGRGGPAEPPAAVRWADKPRGEPYAAFLSRVDAPAVWVRRLVLGPARELAIAGEDAAGAAGRVRVA